MLGFRQIRSLATSLKTTWIRLTVDLEDPNISPEILDRLSYDENCVFRCLIAKNPSTPPETLNRLSYDEDCFVVWHVTENLNAPPEALDRLYCGGSEALDRLYCGGYIWFLNDVLRNPNTPQYVLDLIKFKEYLKYYEQP